MSKLDQMMAQSPIDGREDVLKWLIELYELWGGSEAPQVSRRRQAIARLIFNVSGVTPGAVEGKEGQKLRQSDRLAWCIRLAINTLLDTTTGDELARQRQRFLTAAATVPLPPEPQQRFRLGGHS